MTEQKELSLTEIRAIKEAAERRIAVAVQNELRQVYEKTGQVVRGVKVNVLLHSNWSTGSLTATSSIVGEVTLDLGSI